MPAADEQFNKHEEWLKKHDVRRALSDLTPEEMVSTQKFYPRWTGRRDKVCISEMYSHFRSAVTLPYSARNPNICLSHSFFETIDKRNSRSRSK